MCQIILQSAEFFALLLLIDIDLAAVAKSQGCHDCQGTLHQAHYPRKPRGAKCALGDEYLRRFSFCCAVCRHRTTPVSVRFLGRRVYLGIVVALASALVSGLSGQRIGKLVAGLGVPVLTLRRWRQWWLDDFVRMPLWRAQRALFSKRPALPPVMLLDKPSSSAFLRRMINGFISTLETTYRGLVGQWPVAGRILPATRA